MTLLSPWILAVSYWLHMIATIVWVGGLALMALVVWPGARAVLGPGPELASLIRRLQSKFSAMAWASLAVLTATGLTQMAGNENYTGVLQIDNPWAVAILVKHLAIGGMILIGVYMQMQLQPALARLALLEARGHAAPEAEKLRQRELNLTRLNLVCGVLVLGFTAVAQVL